MSVYSIIVVVSGVLFLLGTCGCGSKSNANGSDASTDDDSGADTDADSEHDQEGDCEYGAVNATIELKGSTAEISGDGAVCDGSTLTLTSGGVFKMSGTLSDGRIVVSSQDNETVKLVLDGVSVTNTTGAAIVVGSASKVIIILNEGSSNTVADSSSHTDGMDANGAITSSDDLTICGGGSITVNGNYLDGIAAKDGLIINGGILNVTGVDDGIRGKDYLVINGGEIDVTSGGDGLTSNNEEDADKGYVRITGGIIEVDSGGDAISGETDVLVVNGALTLKSGGGSNASVVGDVSAKGVKGLVSVVFEKGTFLFDSADDGIHSNGAVEISGGSFEIATGDDGIHADSSLSIKGAEVLITESYEGIESMVITIDDGNIHLSSSDDGLNSADPDATSGEQPGPGDPGGFEVCEECFVYINGGYLFVDAAGDGLDSNGNMDIAGGTIIVNGPTQTQNSALDCNGDFSISGGFLVSVHEKIMSDEIDGASTQNVLNIDLQSSLEPGTIVHIQDDESQDVLTFAPAKSFRAVVFSSEDLIYGSYSLYTGGSSTGSDEDGLYNGGIYTPGNLVSDFDIVSTFTNIGGGYPY